MCAYDSGMASTPLSQPVTTPATAQDLRDLFVNGFTPTITVEIEHTDQFGGTVALMLNGYKVGEVSLEFPVLGTEHTCWHAADGECEYDDDADCPNVGPYIARDLRLALYANDQREFGVDRAPNY